MHRRGIKELYRERILTSINLIHISRSLQSKHAETIVTSACNVLCHCEKIKCYF